MNNNYPGYGSGNAGEEYRSLLAATRSSSYSRRSGGRKITRPGWVIIMTILILAAVITSCVVMPPWKWLFGGEPVGKRNVIFMVSDGFGPASETMARDYYQYVSAGSPGLPDWQSPDYPKQLPLDTILVGSSRTRSSSSWITDSAAGATAFSCGLRTYNGAIGVNSTRAPCLSVMEVAKASGFMTAQVVTSRITHATPAAFNAHVEWRDDEPLIAQHQLGETPFGLVTDLMFGGGRCEFQPQSVEGSCRKDQRDLLAEAKSRFGFKNVVQTRAEFDALSAGSSKLPILGVFTPGHMSYEIDRDDVKEPALFEMAQKALDIMTDATRDSEKGFFMMIEGSRIDMAAHDNDPGTHVREILAYQKTIETVKNYIEKHPGTIMISVSDHETGGLSVGRQLGESYPIYEWKPEPLVRQQKSADYLSSLIMKMDTKGADRAKLIKETVCKSYLGLSDLKDEELNFLVNAKTKMQIQPYLAEMMSKRAVLGWATHGHSGVDVNLYAFAGSTLTAIVDPLRRNLANFELNTFMQSYLGLKADLASDMYKKLIEAWKNGEIITVPTNSDKTPGVMVDILGAEHHRPQDGYHVHF
eukprot:Partr_v1_DN26167_c0_g1_i1_m10322 putative Alkaline phosphatase